MITLQWSETALEFLHEDIPGSENMIPVFSIYNGKYHWKMMLTLFCPSDKQFYWHCGSGCECCESLSSQIENKDSLKCGDERAVKQALRAFIADHPNLVNEDEKRTLFSKIKKHR